jgi:transposase-like protein
MTKKKRRQVLPEQRKRIILALMEPGCDVGELAKKYNLARSTLLRYRQQYKKQKSGDLLLSKKPHFIEVKTVEDKILPSLTKVELSFDNHRCSVEGRLSSNQLLKLVALFEEATC